MSLKNFDYSATELLEAVRINCVGKKRNASIGMGLDCLIKLAKIGREFKGDCDGIDALCYHLDVFTCQDAIAALQNVIQRMKE